ncbi:MAG: hypothetical protein M0T75_04375 [Chloroflexi bacterium]|nr:hypothetical protein [Chloroflexota bacterium]
MTIHAPAHPGGAVAPQVHHHYFAWLAIVAAVILAVGAVMLAPADLFNLGTSSATDEQRSLVEFRAGERGSWIAGIVGSERDALIEFRAAERDSR